VDYFLINTMPLTHSNYVFLDDEPIGAERFGFRMAIGELMGDDYPTDARVYLDRSSPGVELSDLVANSNDFLILSSSVQKRLAGSLSEPVEYLPLAIYNHKRRLASSEYFIVNPLGTVDALDRERSKIEWLGADIVEIEKLVLDPEKLKHAPDLFRLKEEPSAYVISQRLIAQLTPPPPSNFYVQRLEQ
jgi:hypothetical protein